MINEEIANRSMSSSKSAPITVASRIAAALIILGGGRRIEAMRTHGISKTFCYQNSHSVVSAINRHPTSCFIYNL